MKFPRWAKCLSVSAAALLFAASSSVPALAGEPDFLDPAQAFVGSAHVANS